IDWPGLGGERRLALEVHAREIHHEIGVAGEQRLDARRRRFPRMGQEDRRLAPGRERALQALGGADVEVAVDDDRELPLGGDLEELLELGAARVTIDLPRELADVDLADRARVEPVDLALDAIDSGGGGYPRGPPHPRAVALFARGRRHRGR